MYSAKLLDHFQRPRGVGELPDATHRARVENPACGDVLELSLRISDGVIEQAAFKAKGCVPAMACASVISEMLANKQVHEASSISREQIRHAVDDVPPASGHALDLAVDAIRAALSSPLKG